MFADLRSPSPSMSTFSDGRPGSSQHLPRCLSESRQADYELAMQLRDTTPRRAPSKTAVSLMLGTAPDVGASPTSPYACWIVDVDVRLTEEASALSPVQFIAQVRVDPSTGKLQLLSDAAGGEGGSAGTPEVGIGGQPGGDREGRSSRCALVSRVATSQSFERMNYQSLFQTAKMRGVSFDLFHNVGCIFTYLDMIHSLFSLMAVDRTVEHCCKRMAAAVGALAEGAQAPVGSSKRSKLAAPRDPAPLPGREAGSGALTIGDVQTALRGLSRRGAGSEKQRGL